MTRPRTALALTLAAQGLTSTEIAAELGGGRDGGLCLDHPRNPPPPPPRPVPFRAGPDPASRYQHPVAGRRAHLRVRFRSPRAGVLALGAARYRGLGLLAAE